MIKQPDLARQRPPIRGWLGAIVVVLAMRLPSGFLSVLTVGAVLSDINPALNPVYFLLSLLNTAVTAAVIALYLATLVGLVRGDRRFRKFFAVQLIIRLIMLLMQAMLYGGTAEGLDTLIAIALTDGLMLLYFYKSWRVREGYFPEAAATCKEEPSEDKAIDEGW